jgi:ubiquinone/menaquinone biosynthesis C-methylase UbiE
MTRLLKMPKLIYQVAKVKLSQGNSNPIADYDKGAVSFDDYYSRNLGSSALELWEKLPVKEGQVIVDLACGTGFFTTKLAHAVGQTGQIIAVDLSAGMLEKNQEKAVNQNLNNIRFVQLDGLSFLESLSSNCLDGLVCGWGTCYMNHTRLRQQLERVLKTGGFFGMIDNTSSSLKDVSDLFTQVLMDYPHAMIKNININLPKNNDYLIKTFGHGHLKSQNAWNGEVIIPCVNGEQIADYMLKSVASAGFIDALDPALIPQIFETFVSYANQRFYSQNPVVVRHKFCALVAIKN